MTDNQSQVSEHAQPIEDLLKNEPQSSVQDIAAHLDLKEDEVVAVLDAHRVWDDGTITYEGPGFGGGWTPARLAERQRAEQQIDLIDEQIKEREGILDNLRHDADPEVKQGLVAMINELTERRQELAG